MAGTSPAMTPRKAIAGDSNLGRNLIDISFVIRRSAKLPICWAWRRSVPGGASGLQIRERAACRSLVGSTPTLFRHPVIRRCLWLFVSAYEVTVRPAFSFFTCSPIYATIRHNIVAFLEGVADKNGSNDCSSDCERFAFPSVHRARNALGR